MRQANLKTERSPFSNSVWWLHPAFGALALGIPTVIAGFVIPDSTYLTLYSSAKHLDASFLLIALIVYISFAAGTLISVSRGKQAQTTEVIRYAGWVIWPLFVITVLAHVVWLLYAAATGGGIGVIITSLSSLLSNPEIGTSDYIKFELFQTIPGITTLGQLGILYATVESILWRLGKTDRRVAMIRIFGVAMCVVPRALLLSGRISLLEVTIPVVVVFVVTLTSRSRLRALMHLAPPVMGLLVFALFAAGEYFRSWTYYKNVYTGSYPEFAVDRFLGYYAMAANNAAVFYYFEPVQPLRYTLNSFIQFPVIGESITGLYSWFFDRPIFIEPELLLDTYANFEYNNVAWFGLMLNEGSLLFAPVLAFVSGAIAVSLYRSMLRGRMLGVLLYPSWFIGILELPRIYYWTDQRYFPVLAFVVLSLIMFKLAKVPGVGRSRSTPADLPSPLRKESPPSGSRPRALVRYKVTDREQR